MKRRRTAVCLVLATILTPAASSPAANWSLTRVNHMVLAPPVGVTVQQMSGATYLGPVGGAYRFLAAEQTAGELVQFDVSVDSAGAITAMTNVAAIDIASNADFEGVAYTGSIRNSVFLSDELAAGPRVLEVNLTTGTNIQSVAIPAIFTGNARTNRGFESLARSLDASEMWTANEEALTVDGAAATPDAGTVVRLVRFNVAGNTVAAAAQFAYPVEPMHGPYLLGNGQSGLSDLTLMPDGTLLALERSLASVATLAYRSRIFEIDFAGATDVSVGPPASGLSGQSYTPVGKQALFDGAADGALGQNLEGLALGPRLANGSWLLLGVVDDRPDDLDTLSANTVVAFVATPVVSADFDADSDVDGADFLAWQRGLGKTVGAKRADGDADRDGDVDAADLATWKAAASGITAQATPEPAGGALLATAFGALVIASRLKNCRGERTRAGEGNRTLA